ncbi:MAG: nuclear transport factor 2 family protein [Solirubrobacteraceae bacterium]
MSRIEHLEAFHALDAFFATIKQGVAGLVDGDHFFDLLTDDVVFEYVITVPGYPRRVEGRHAVAELYRPYGTRFFVDRCYDLSAYHDPLAGVVVLEYANQGRFLPTGAPYENHFVSVLTIVDRKITHWRDYLDPIAVFDAAGWPENHSTTD